MPVSNRKGYIIGRTMKNFIFASMLAMAANQLAITINGIVVGNFIGPQAMAAINLIMPVNLVFSTLATFLGCGATILASKALGRRDFEEAGHIISTALICILGIGVIIGVAGSLYLERIAAFICSEENILPLVKAYLSVFMASACIPMLYIVFEQMVNIDGRPVLVTKATVVYAAVNVVLDLILVGWFKFRLEATAISTIVGQLCAILIASTHIFSRRCSYRLNLLKPHFSRYIGGNLKNGASLMISNLILVFLFWGINTIVARNLGENGLFAISICINLLSIGMMLGSGIGQSLFVIGGLFIGQEDFSGLRILAGKVFRAVTITLAVFFVLSEAIPGVLARIFGAEEECLIAFTARALRIFAVCLIPFCLSLVFSNLYQVLGRLILVPLVILSFPVFLIPAMFILTGDCLWYAFPAASLMALVVIGIISLVVRHKDRSLTRFTLLPPVSEDETDFSIEASGKDSIFEFIDDKAVSKKIAVVLKSIGQEQKYIDIILLKKTDRTAVTIWTDTDCTAEDITLRKMFGMNMITFEIENTDI